MTKNSLKCEFCCMIKELITETVKDLLIRQIQITFERKEIAPEQNVLDMSLYTKIGHIRMRAKPIFRGK